MAKNILRNMTYRDLLACFIVIVWFITNIIMACVNDIYFILNNCLWYCVIMMINLVGLLSNKINSFLDKPVLNH